MRPILHVRCKHAFSLTTHNLMSAGHILTIPSPTTAGGSIHRGGSSVEDTTGQVVAGGGRVDGEVASTCPHLFSLILTIVYLYSKPSQGLFLQLLSLTQHPSGSYLSPGLTLDSGPRFAIHFSVTHSLRS